MLRAGRGRRGYMTAALIFLGKMFFVALVLACLFYAGARFCQFVLGWMGER